MTVNWVTWAPLGILALILAGLVFRKLRLRRVAQRLDELTQRESPQKTDGKGRIPMNGDRLQSDAQGETDRPTKLTLPATEVFYRRAMERSAEIKTKAGRDEAISSPDRGSEPECQSCPQFISCAMNGVDKCPLLS